MTAVVAARPVFADRLNGQVAVAFAAESQFLACAVFCDTQTMPQLARFFYARARQQRRDALRMVRYLVRTASVTLPGLAPPLSGFGAVIDPVVVAVETDRRSGEHLRELARIARDEHDYAAEQFVQWFITANVTQVAAMNELRQVVARNADRVGEIEQFVARERELLDEDPGAPRQAGTWPS